MVRHLLVFLVCLILLNCKRAVTYSPPEGLKVLAINASLPDPAGTHNYIEFDVPVKFHKDILELLTGAKEDNNPSKWEVYGGLTIQYPHKIDEVGLYSTHQKLGAFDINRTYYRGASDKQFIDLLQQAYQESLIK